MRHREKWRLALDMLDEVITEWDLLGRPVVADAGYGDATEFRLGLTERGLTYVLAVSPTATAHPAEAVPVTPAWKGTGRPPQPRYPDPPRAASLFPQAAHQRVDGDRVKPGTIVDAHSRVDDRVGDRRLRLQDPGAGECAVERFAPCSTHGVG